MDNTTGVPGADPTLADSTRRIKDSASTIKDSASTLLDRGKDAAMHKAEEGAERLARGLTDGPVIEARARWPLDADATPVIGSGRLGTKA